MVDRHRLRAARVGVVDDTVGHVDLVRKRERRPRRDEALGEHGAHGHDLERRAGLVRVRDSPVALKVARGRRIAIRVVAALDGHGENPAGPGVEHDRGGRLRSPVVDRAPQHGLGLGLDRVVEREADVLPRVCGLRVEDIDHLPGGIANDSLAARLPRELALELELETGEAMIVRARVADDLRPDLAQRVDALFLGDEAEPREPQLLQLLGPNRIGLAHEVHEAVRAIGQPAQDVVRIDAERAADGVRGRRRVTDLVRVRIDRRRLAADRELNPGPVIDGAAAAGVDDGLVVLVVGQARVAPGPYPLQPRRAQEQRGEAEREDGEREPDPPVRLFHRRSWT